MRSLKGLLMCTAAIGVGMAQISGVHEGATKVSARVRDKGDYALRVCGETTPRKPADAGKTIDFDVPAGGFHMAEKGLRRNQTVELVGPDDKIVEAAIVPDRQSAPARGRGLAPKLAAPLIEGSRTIKATVHETGIYELEVCGVSIASKSVQDESSDTIEFDLENQTVMPSLRNGLPANYVVRLRSGTREARLVVSRSKEVRLWIRPVKEGQQAIEGQVDGDIKQLRVELLEPDGSPVSRDLASVEAKKFTSALPVAVSAGQTVLVTGVDALGSARTLVESYGFGRVRYYFSAGATIATQDVPSQQDITKPVIIGGQQYKPVPPVTETVFKREFSSADAFVSLNLDYNWISTLRDRYPVPCRRPDRINDHLKKLSAFLPDIRERYRNSGPKAFKELAASIREIVEQLRSSERECSGSTDAASRVLLSEIEYSASIIESSEFAEAVERQKPIDKKALTALKTAIQIQQVSPQDSVKKQETQINKCEPPDSGKKCKATEPPKDGALYPDVYLKHVRDLVKLVLRSDPNGRDAAWLFNTSFEGRLSQAPSATANAIIQNPRSGALEMAAYVPSLARSMQWEYKGRENALFFAPLVKVGLQPVIHDPLPEAKRNPSIMAWHSYGFRFGHFSIDPRRQTIAPELLSYLDLTFGKFDSFLDNGVRRWRVESSGRFKFPGTPIYAGFGTNFGPGPDDLRVFFGTRFDLGKAIASTLKVGEK